MTFLFEKWDYNLITKQSGGTIISIIAQVINEPMKSPDVAMEKMGLFRERMTELFPPASAPLLAVINEVIMVVKVQTLTIVGQVL